MKEKDFIRYGVWCESIILYSILVSYACIYSAFGFYREDFVAGCIAFSGVVLAVSGVGISMLSSKMIRFLNPVGYGASTEVNRLRRTHTKYTDTISDLGHLIAIAGAVFSGISTILAPLIVKVSIFFA